LVPAVHYLIQRTQLTLHFYPLIVVLPVEEKAPISGPPTAAPADAEKKYPAQRRSRRAKIVRPLRVRPSGPRDEHFEDTPTSVNASKEGIFFTTRKSNYYKGMRVFVTFPFTSAHDPMNCEYVAEVVRVETLPNKRFGVAVHLLGTMNMKSGGRPGLR
jgi:hypothetical protein